MSRRQDIVAADEWFAGEDKTLIFSMVDDTLPNSPVLDITGFTLRFKVSASKSGNALFTKVVVVTDGPGGIAETFSPQADTINLDTAGDTIYWYTVRRIDPGSAEEFLYGTIDLLDVYVNYVP